MSRNENLGRRYKSMKMKTRWKNQKGLTTVGQRCFSDEIGGFFVIKKVQKCKKYSDCAVAPDGSRWFEEMRAFIRTDNGSKYIVPYLWLLLHSVDKHGRRLAR